MKRIRKGSLACEARGAWNTFLPRVRRRSAVPPTLNPSKLSLVKTPRYFQVIRSRPDRIIIRVEWIRQVVGTPEHEETQEDGRIRQWARIPDAGDRYLLRVVLLRTVKPSTTPSLTVGSGHENPVFRGYGHPLHRVQGRGCRRDKGSRPSVTGFRNCCPRGALTGGEGCGPQRNPGGSPAPGGKGG
jgi:hypothetical protein